MEDTGSGFYSPYDGREVDSRKEPAVYVPETGLSLRGIASMQGVVVEGSAETQDPETEGLRDGAEPTKPTAEALNQPTTVVPNSPVISEVGIRSMQGSSPEEEK